MSVRWLTGVFLFALGCGSAMLVRLPASASMEGVVEGTLTYVDGDENFQLNYPPGGETAYLVISSYKEGAKAVPKVSYETDSATYSKEGLESLAIFRVTPVVLWDGDIVRCNDPAAGERPPLCPLPPPPGPPIHNDYMFFQSQPGAPGGPR